MIYLDNHATTRLDPRVLEAMLPWLTDRYGNAGSVTHEMGREARAAVEAARETFAAAIGAEPREIVFTSGATESANLAILGSASRAHDHGGPGHVVTLEAEHRAVLDPVEHLERTGTAVTRLPVIGQRDGDGRRPRGPGRAGAGGRRGPDRGEARMGDPAHRTRRPGGLTGARVRARAGRAASLEPDNAGR